MFTVSSQSEFISKLPTAYVATALFRIICSGPTIRFIVTRYMHDTDWLAYVTSATEGKIWPNLIL